MQPHVLVHQKPAQLQLQPERARHVVDQVVILRRIDPPRLLLPPLREICPVLGRRRAPDELHPVAQVEVVARLQLVPQVAPGHRIVHAQRVRAVVLPPRDARTRVPVLQYDPVLLLVRPHLRLALGRLPEPQPPSFSHCFPLLPLLDQEPHVAYSIVARVYSIQTTTLHHRQRLARARGPPNGRSVHIDSGNTDNHVY